MNMDEVARDCAPQNPLTVNSHVGDTIHNCQKVVEFLQEALPSQLRDDAPEAGAEGARLCLMMVTDALAYAQDQLRVHGLKP